MKRVCCTVLGFFLLLTGGLAQASDDPVMDKIYGLSRDDYQGMFAMTEETDGVYADALATVLSGSFFCDPVRFLNALGTADAERQETVIGLIAYITHTQNGCATHPFLILEDELSIAAEDPGTDAAVVQRFRDGVAEYWEYNGPDATY